MLRMGDERRKSQRYPIGRVTTLEAPESISCQLADVSATGARIIIDNPQTLPEEFVLTLNDKLQRWCLIRWRSRTEVGVEFTGRPVSSN